MPSWKESSHVAEFSLGCTGVTVMKYCSRQRLHLTRVDDPDRRAQRNPLICLIQAGDCDATPRHSGFFFLGTGWEEKKDLEGSL